MHVKAKDKATGKEQSIKIEGSSGLSEDEKKRMTADAEKHAAEDATRKELAETRNLGETLIYTSEKLIKDHGDKIKEEDKKELNDKIEPLKNALKGDNLEEIKKVTEELSKVAQKVGGEMYKNNPPAGGPADEQPKPEEPKEEVKDAK